MITGKITGSGLGEGQVYLAARREGEAWITAGPFTHGERMEVVLKGGYDLDFLCVTGEEGRERPVEPEEVVLTSVLASRHLSRYVEREPGGRIRLSGLPAGAYMMRVTATGFMESMVRSMAPAPEKQDGPTQVRFEAGHHLEVLVRTGQGLPVKGARLIPLPLETMWRGQSFQAPKFPTVFTDDAGRARLGPLPTGRIPIGVWHPRLGSLFADARIPAQQPLVINFSCGRIEGWIEPPGPAPGGRPWQVVLEGESPVPLRFGKVSPEGTFLFEQVPPGRWELVVMRPLPAQSVESLFFFS